MRFLTPWKQSGTIGFAWPIGLPLGAPTYTFLPRGPRINLQITQEFSGYF